MFQAAANGLVLPKEMRMPKTLIFGWMVLFLAHSQAQCVPLTAADEIKVTFRLHAPELAEDARVYITGSVPALGSWNPGKISMNYAGEHEWTFELTLRQKQSIEYKYTLGSWEKEGADADGRPLQNLVLDVEKSTERRDQIVFWTNRAAAASRDKISGQVTGQVKYHRQLKGEGVLPRDVIVWLPPDYDTADARYPVLYMHDGQNIVDPRTSAFGVDWQVDETCTRLIAEHKIKPLIIVGIYNTRDRSREYLPGEAGTAYMKFVVDSVKPLIDEHYRTNPARSHTYAAGSSAGGLCAFMLAWEHSAVFSKAICMSPAFKFKNAEGSRVLDYVTTVEKSQRPADPLTLYIDNGGVGAEKSLQPGIDDMLAALKAKGFQADRDFRWVHAPDDRHNESAWANRFAGAIQFLAPGD